MKKIFIVLLLVSLKTYGQNHLNTDSNRNLLDSNLRAQTINQLAQAEYYSKQKTRDNSNWISVLSVLVAGFISFGSAAYLSIRALRNEKEKTMELKRKEYLTEARLASSELISKVAQGLQSITWVLWIAKFTPNLFDNKVVIEHDKKMRAWYSEIVAAQVALAARNETLYTNTIEIVNSLYQFDGNLGGLVPGLYDNNKRNQAIKEIGEMWKEVYDYLQNIPSLFSTKLKTAL
jgi:hypothetical protein